MMIEETAVIVECDGEFAWVEAQRKSACGQCSANKACGTGVLAKLTGNRRTRMKALNRAQAREGETVLIGLQESALVRSSLIIYLLPIVVMILFAMFGEQMAEQWQIASAEALSILFALLGLLLAGGAIRLFSAHVRGNPRYQPVVLKRLASLDNGKFRPYSTTTSSLQ